MLEMAVIVPVYGRPDLLDRCLEALEAAGVACADIVVVDDASPDDRVAAVATSHNTRLIRLPVNRGPAAARNAGAEAASAAQVLFFVDADVVVSLDVLRCLETVFANPATAAVFGCYDDQPAETDLLSQYVNLRHREVHRLSEGPAETFWAGCGAVRRAAFEAVGGFDPSSRWNFIEDVELGRRMHRAGYAILLDPALPGKHLKRWTLAISARTNALYRARPWMRLMLEETRMMRGLNAGRGGQISMLVVAATPACVVLAPWWPPSLILVALALLAIPVLNRPLFTSFARTRGLGFALACVPLHAFHLACVAIGLASGLVEHVRQRRASARPGARLRSRSTS